jgi:hypothetical protein
VLGALLRLFRAVLVAVVRSSSGTLLGGRLLLLDLVDAHPDLAIDDAEAHDVVDKGLAPARAGRDAKVLEEHLAHQSQVRLRVERAVERQDRPRALEAVARKVQLALRRDGVDVELDEEEEERRLPVSSRTTPRGVCLCF